MKKIFAVISIVVTLFVVGVCGLFVYEWVRYEQRIAKRAIQQEKHRLLTELRSATETTVHSTHYPNGVLKEKGRYVGGKKDGEWNTYFFTGTLQESKYYTNGKLIGSFNVVTGVKLEPQQDLILEETKKMDI